MSMWEKFIVGACLVCSLVFLQHIANPEAAQQPRAAEAKVLPVEVTDFSWVTGGFGSIMLLNLSIRNNQDYPVKDIVIRCTHYAPSGTQIDENTRTLYERISAHGTISEYKFNMGFVHSQADRSRCRVVGHSRA